MDLIANLKTYASTKCILQFAILGSFLIEELYEHFYFSLEKGCIFIAIAEYYDMF